MQQLDIKNTHQQVLEAWEYGTVAGGSRCTVLNHPDGYALLTLSDLCALRFLQDINKQADLDPVFPQVSAFLPSGVSYANGLSDDVFVCTEPVTPLRREDRSAVMSAARATFGRTAVSPDSDEAAALLTAFRHELEQRLDTGNNTAFEALATRVLKGLHQALTWWRANAEHAPRESFVFGTALTHCAWQTPRGAVLLPHLFCKD